MVEAVYGLILLDSAHPIQQQYPPRSTHPFIHSGTVRPFSSMGPKTKCVLFPLMWEINPKPHALPHVPPQRIEQLYHSASSNLPLRTIVVGKKCEHASLSHQLQNSRNQ